MPRPLQLLIAATVLLVPVAAQRSELLEEVRKCVEEEGFGNSSLVCDPHSRLANNTVEKLQGLLGGLSRKIECSCVDGCKREDGTEGYIGLIHVTNSFATRNLSDDMATVYRERGLGNGICNHGLLLAYLNDTHKLASYRGGRSFVQLSDEDMIRLHEIAKKGDHEGDTLALQYLLNNYKDISESPVQRAESWTPVIGLIAAILLVLLALAILLSLFLARFCCCCVNRNKEVYHVTPTPTYKTVDPIYVVTPHPGERFPPGPHSEALYSTPYSGSPVPLVFPPPPGASRPITPASTHRIRARPSALSEASQQRGTFPRMTTAPGGGIVIDRGGRPGGDSRDGSGSGTLRRGPRSPIEEDPDYAAVPADGRRDMEYMRDQSEMYASLPRHPMMMPPPHGMPPGMPLMVMPPGGTLPRPGMPPPHPGMIPLPGMMLPSPRSDVSSNRTGSFTMTVPPGGGELPFLDPKRKMETQTIEETIY